MPFVAKKKPFVWKKEKKIEKTLLTTPIWQKKTKSQRKNKLVFFFFRFLELFLFAMENHFKNLLQIFLNTTESKSLILLANWNRICKFCLFANIFWKKKNNYKIQTYLRNLNSHHVGLFWKMKEARKSKQKHKITLNDIWALLIIVYLVKKRNKNKKRT